jgi:CHAT domain-containing protein
MRLFFKIGLMGLALFLWSSRMSAQEKDTTEAYQYLQAAQTFNDQGYYDSAIYYFTAAGNAYRRAEMDKRVLEAFNNVGLLHLALNRLEKGRRYLDSIVRVGEEAFPTHINEQALAHIYLGVYFSKKGEFDSTISAYQTALSLQNQSASPAYFDMIMAYSNIGSSLNERGYFEQATTFLDTALTLSESLYGSEETMTGIICNNLGFSYSNLGDYGKAEKYFLKANQIERTCLGEDHPQVAVTYLNLARCIQEREDYEKAGEYFNKSLKTFEKYLGPDHPRVASTLTNIGFNLRLRKELDQSALVLRKALAIKKSALPENHFSIGVSMGHLAATLAELGKLESAIGLFQQNLDIYEEAYGKNHPNVARIYRELGRIYRKNQQPEKAWQSFAKAVECMAGSPVKERYFMPNLDSIVLHTELIFSYYDLGMQYRYDFNRTKNIKDLETALEVLYTAQALNDRVRRSFQSFASKEILSAKTDVIYENGVEIAFQLYQETGKETYLNDIFFFSEKKKSLILLEGVKNIQAKKFARMAPDLIEKEAKLKAELAYFDKKYYLEKLKGDLSQEEPARRYRDSIFDISVRLNQLLSKMESSYPEYYRLKYMATPPSIAELQTNWLAPDQAMLSLLKSQDTLYLLLIRNDLVKAKRIVLDFSLETAIKELREGIFGYFSDVLPSESVFQIYTKKYAERAHELYGIIIKPMGEYMPQKLVIIPDGILGLIPFEALLSGIPDAWERFDQYPYLLKKYQLTYGLSATLLQDASGKRTDLRGELIAFAPEFDHNVFDIAEGENIRKHTLRPLAHNQKEVKRIRRTLGEGKVFTGKAATVERFKRLAPKHGLLHIATHAYINDDNPNYSFLAFSEDTARGGEDLLYMRDLFALELQSEMAVLSACETGVGKVLKGEGIASLARGFSFAGVKSLVTSLWSVNDATTAELMSGFYQNLTLHKTKDEALRQAKLDYLSTKDAYLAHPFYWASFIVIGDVQPISSTNSLEDFLLLGLLGLVAIVLFFKMIRTFFFMKPNIN